MAESRHKLTDSEATQHHGLMVAAMSYRVKYRHSDSAGKAIMRWVRVEGSGTHSKNRGGVYPAGLRCKGLCIDVLLAGFSKEQLNHQSVAVEVAPMTEILRSGVWPGNYNAENCAKDELLYTCFQEPYGDVRHNMLSHNHMMLVLRAFLTKAKWDIVDESLKAKNITCCDSEGRLSVAAVAGSPNGKELAEVLAEGMYCEVLSWKMDVECPDAASIISQSLNQPQQTAMRTTEVTALAVLNGEIIVQMGADLSQNVAFQTVRDRVRDQLHVLADDPDLPEVFDFLISCGAGKNGYIANLMEWLGRFVDSKKRQLRISAFTVINKMPAEGPLSKVAVLKRAYRKTPGGGFCQNPEAAWGTFRWATDQGICLSHGTTAAGGLRLLEELLRFFHVYCDEYTAQLDPYERILLVGNIDVQCADLFFGARTAKSRFTYYQMREFMLDGTKKFLCKINIPEDIFKRDLAQAAPDIDGKQVVSGKADWIHWGSPVNPSNSLISKSGSDCPEAAVGKMAGPPEGPIVASVIGFNETTGAQLNVQVSAQASTQSREKDGLTPQRLPWREWRTGAGKSMGDVEADMGSAVAVLHSIHTNFAAQGPIEVWQLSAKVFVTATYASPPGEVLLPPCVPKGSKVYASTVHPNAVEISLKVFKNNEQIAVQIHDESLMMRTGTYFLHPEFKIPKRKEKKITELGEDEIEEDAKPSHLTAVADEWDWSEEGSTSMHPFWAVRRLTRKQLAIEVQKFSTTAPEKNPPRFNCCLERQTVSSCVVGVASNGAGVNTTRLWEIPFLTNSVQLDEGEELIMEAIEKAAPKTKAPSWKDSLYMAQRSAKSRKTCDDGSKPSSLFHD